MINEKRCQQRKHFGEFNCVSRFTAASVQGDCFIGCLEARLGCFHVYPVIAIVRLEHVACVGLELAAGALLANFLCFGNKASARERQTSLLCCS